MNSKLPRKNPEPRPIGIFTESNIKRLRHQLSQEQYITWVLNELGLGLKEDKDELSKTDRAKLLKMTPRQLVTLRRAIKAGRIEDSK